MTKEIDDWWNNMVQKNLREGRLVSVSSRSGFRVMYFVVAIFTNVDFLWK